MQNEYLLPTTRKPLIYLCFLKSYSYTPTIVAAVVCFLVLGNALNRQQKRNRGN